MVGLLNAPKGTQLYHRLERECRISSDFTGDNTNYSMNFTPKMNEAVLMDGYKSIINTIYAPKYYYQRVTNFLKEYKPSKSIVPHFSIHEIAAFFKANFLLGIIGKERKYYWKLFGWSLFKRPGTFARAITLSIYGYHFRKIFEVCEPA
jgi:hypothetical protein